MVRQHPLRSLPSRHRILSLAAVAVLALQSLLALGCGRVAPSWEPATLTVRSDPAGAAIVLDGQQTGEVTPHTFTGLTPSAHEVRVTMAEWFADPETLEVELGPAGEATVDIPLYQTGLRVTSEPAGAHILIDGADTGKVTPAVVAGLTGTSVDVSLALDTYVCLPASAAVAIEAGTISEVPPGTLRLRSRRTVMLESFGNINCTTCPQAADTLFALMQRPAYGPDRALFVEFAVSWPSPVDPFYMHNPTEQADRYTYYYVMGAPAVYVDGTGQTDPLAGSAIAAAVAARWQDDPGFLLDVDAVVGSGPSVPVTVTLQPLANVDLTGCVLFVALYQDLAAYEEAPGNNGQKDFHHMFRDRIDAPPALGPLAAGVPDVRGQFSLNRGDLAADNLTIVAFVQRLSDHAVLQAGSYRHPTAAAARP